MNNKIPKNLAFDKTHSIFFHSTKKFENRKSDGYCNYEEVSKIARHISEMEKIGVPASEIGIICTYKMQLFVMKSNIKKAVSLKYYKELKIDTVDAFQGSEMEYIFLSLVRSNKRNDTGFLKDQKRANVAISRHKLGLFIFGNKSTISTIECWRNIIKKASTTNYSHYSNSSDSQGSDDDNFGGQINYINKKNKRRNRNNQRRNKNAYKVKSNEKSLRN